MKKLALAVLASGEGTNLQAIIDAIKKKKLPTEIKIVISNNSDAGALARAKKHGIRTLHLSPKQFATPEQFDAALISTLKGEKAELICLVGYMKRLSPAVVRAFKSKIINIHPALLPEFGGGGMYGVRVHEAVLKSGAKVTGVTVHFVDEEYDHGAIIFQKKLGVKSGDTPETLQRRVQKLEHQVYPKVIESFAKGKVKVSAGKVTVR